MSTLMTPLEIKKAIKNWQLILNNPAELVNHFSQGFWFYYNYQQYDIHSGHIHAYPGIVDGVLKFFMIPAAYDKAHFDEEINRYVTVCDMQKNTPNGGRIPSKDAVQRIQNWNNYYQDWIPVQVNTPDGMFMAFRISANDFEVEQPAVSMGLVSSITSVTAFDSDMIVVNQENKAAVFDDFAQPVPPFSSTALSAENFYLLQMNVS